jgi:hypothetical protein
MTIRSILAAYSGDAAGCSGLDLALFMQRKYDAQLTGVVWHGSGLIETRFLERQRAVIEAGLKPLDRTPGRAGGAGRGSAGRRRQPTESMIFPTCPPASSSACAAAACSSG